MENLVDKIANALDKDSLYSVLGNLSNDQWADPDIHNAVLEAVQWFREAVMEMLGWSLPENAYEQYADVMEEALGIDGSLLRHIPVGLRNKSLCERAVMTSGAALEFVPKRLRTDDICLAAVRLHPYGHPIQHFPERLLTEEILLPILRNTKGRAFAFIPQEKRTEALCEEAVRFRGDNLCLVPVELRTKDICFEAAKKYAPAVSDIPEKYFSRDFCERLAKERPVVISLIQEKYLTLKAYYEAVSRESSLIRYVPEEMLSRAFLTYVESLSWE